MIASRTSDHTNSGSTRGKQRGALKKGQRAGRIVVVQTWRFWNHGVDPLEELNCNLDRGIAHSVLSGPERLSAGSGQAWTWCHVDSVELNRGRICHGATRDMQHCRCRAPKHELRTPYGLYNFIIVVQACSTIDRLSCCACLVHVQEAMNALGGKT